MLHRAPSQTAATPTGLTETEAASLLAVEGRNETRPAATESALRKVVAQLLDPLIVLLLAAAAVTAAARDWPDTTVILLVVVVNTVIGVVQDIRADHAIRALRLLAAPTCRVVRDGVDRLIPAAEVVRGDLVRCAAGDIIPADLTLLSAHRLQVDESTLTGESLPVNKEQGDPLSAGTVVSAGRGKAVVVRTGSDSALGRIVTLTEQARSGPTPLQQRLSRLGRVLGAWTVGLSAVVAVIGIVQGRPVLEMAIVGVSLVVAAIPESLPAVVTLALALGARRMTAAHAITRRLTAVETLGSVDTLLTDKTGTLTQGRMAVQRAITLDGTQCRINGQGYQPTGGLQPTQAATSLAAMARAVVLCNDAELVAPGPGRPDWTVAGEQLEGALLVFAARAGIDIAALRASWPRLSESPFNPATRLMSTTHHSPDGTTFQVYKGAPEAVLNHHLVTATQDELKTLLAAAEDIARAGMRALAVAAGPPVAIRPLGVVGIGDPIRDNATAVLTRLAAAGVNPIIVTGDHPDTGRHVAEQVGIWRPDDTAVNCDDPDWDRSLTNVRVFGRAAPQQKLSIVEALTARGAVVAVTGDGVNDAPALRRADIGVAMGGGTQVAHQAAQLILADDDLGTVATAVAEGRRVYDNIRRFLRYALAGGVAELMVMLAGPALGLAIPLLPAQILWINLLTHGLPGVAMGAEPGNPAAMHRPPRSPSESVLGGGLGRAVLATGSLIGAITLAAAVLAVHLDLPWQTLTFMTLGLSQLGVALAVRAPRTRGQGNPWLPAAVTLSAALMLAAVTMPPLRDLLGTESISNGQLAAVTLVSTIPGVVTIWQQRRRTTHRTLIKTVRS